MKKIFSNIQREYKKANLCLKFWSLDSRVKREKWNDEQNIKYLNLKNKLSEKYGNDISREKLADMKEICQFEIDNDSDHDKFAMTSILLAFSAIELSGLSFLFGQLDKIDELLGRVNITVTYNDISDQINSSIVLSKWIFILLLVMGFYIIYNFYLVNRKKQNVIYNKFKLRWIESMLKERDGTEAESRPAAAVGSRAGAHKSKVKLKIHTAKYHFSMFF